MAKIVDLASRLEKDEDKILFVHDYLVQNISYTSAPNDDATEELYAALKEKKPYAPVMQDPVALKRPL